MRAKQIAHQTFPSEKKETPLLAYGISPLVRVSILHNLYRFLASAPLVMTCAVLTIQL